MSSSHPVPQWPPVGVALCSYVALKETFLLEIEQERKAGKLGGKWIRIAKTLEVDDVT